MLLIGFNSSLFAQSSNGSGSLANRKVSINKGELVEFRDLRHQLITENENDYFSIISAENRYYINKFDSTLKKVNEVRIKLPDFDFYTDLAFLDGQLFLIYDAGTFTGTKRIRATFAQQYDISSLAPIGEPVELINVRCKKLRSYYRSVDRIKYSEDGRIMIHYFASNPVDLESEIRFNIYSSSLDLEKSFEKKINNLNSANKIDDLVLLNDGSFYLFYTATLVGEEKKSPYRYEFHIAYVNSEGDVVFDNNLPIEGVWLDRVDLHLSNGFLYFTQAFKTDESVDDFRSGVIWGKVKTDGQVVDIKEIPLGLDFMSDMWTDVEKRRASERFEKDESELDYTELEFVYSGVNQSGMTLLVRNIHSRQKPYVFSAEIMREDVDYSGSIYYSKYVYFWLFNEDGEIIIADSFYRDILQKAYSSIFVMDQDNSFEMFFNDHPENKGLPIDSRGSKVVRIDDAVLMSVRIDSDSSFSRDVIENSSELVKASPEQGVKTGKNSFILPFRRKSEAELREITLD